MLTKLNIRPGKGLRDELARELQAYLVKRTKLTVSPKLIWWHFGGITASDMFVPPMREIRQILELRGSLHLRLRRANGV